MDATLERIETDIDQLSLDDQLRLLEHISQKVRQRLTMQHRLIFDDLDRMANDPEMQRELRQIEVEFAETESDGLEDIMTTIQRGEIYFVNLNPVKGREQSGERPVLVLSNNIINSRPLVVTIVVGTKGANISQNYRTNVRVQSEDSGLPLETVFLCFQLRSLDQARFPSQPVGRLDGKILKDIEDTVRYCLGLE